MKLRNFIIVLFALLIVFAFASCKNEPEVKPTPTPGPSKIENPIYQIVVDEGVEKDYYNRDKIKLRWTDVEVNEGSVISLKYRSERGIYQWDIRDEGAGVKWVYETDKNGFVDPVKGEDGWYTLTYTLGKDIKGEDFDYPNDAIAVYFRGRYAAGDVFEIKDITLDGKTLEVAPSTVISKAHLEGEGAIEDHEWTIPENYVYLLAMGALGSVDKNPKIAKVAPNAAIDLSKIPEKENYKIHIYSDSAFANELEETAPVTADATIVYYKYVGDPRLVTIDLNEGTADPAIENITAEYGSPIAEPEVIPTVTDGNLFAGWYKDLTDEAPYDFSTPVTEAFTLHAKYTAPVTVHFNTKGGNAVADAVIASGTAVAQPEEDPTYPANLYLFAGWFADEECTTAYDFSTIITAEKTIYAKWIDAKKVTFNLNYEGAPAATVIGVDTGTAATEPTEVPMRAGWVFEGWYKEEACTTKYDFATLVTADTPLFAKWGYGAMYRVTSTEFTSGYTHDKFVLGFGINEGETKVKAGDTIALSYRTTEPFTWFSVRKNDPNDYSKWFHEKSSGAYPLFFSSKTTGEDGWTTISYVFPEPTDDTQAKQIGYGEDGEGFFIYLGNSKMVPGAFMEVRAVAINGIEVTLTEANIDHVLAQCNPTFEDGVEAYEWTQQTVTFDTGVADAIEPVQVDFGGRVARPETDPAKDGYVFAGWFADAEFTKEFDFTNTPITKATTVYARVGAKKVLSFNSQEGSAVAAIDAAEGAPIEEPEEPTRAGYVFLGWFKEAEGTTAFDFDAGITADTTVYAKWEVAKKLTLNLNYGGAPEATVLDVAGGAAITAPKTPGRAGYYFGGWYNEAECTSEFDMAAGINADTTIYAKWNAPTKEYKYTATKSSDRFQWRFKGSSVALLSSIQPGDVITFQVKFTTATVNPYKYRVRTYESEKELSGGKVAFSAAVDGWYSVTVVAPETGDFIGKNGLYVQLFGSANWEVGDICEMKALAYNGVEIPITTSSSSGGYEGVEGTLEVLNL